MENIGTITWEMIVLSQFEKSIAMSVVLSAGNVGKGQTAALDVPRTGMSP